MIDADRAIRSDTARYELHCRTLPQVEGAASLIELYGGVPSFHDAEVTEVNLRTDGGSTIRLANRYPTPVDAGRVFVTFEIAHLIDVVLDGYNHRQNVLGGLLIIPAPARQERARSHGPLEPGDLEIELDSILGVGGFLICRGVRVSWAMDRPARTVKAQRDLLGQ